LQDIGVTEANDEVTAFWFLAVLVEWCRPCPR